MRDQVARVAHAIADEMCLSDSRSIPDDAVAAAYVQLWAWDQRAVEIHVDAGAVRHALAIAAADRARHLRSRVPADHDSYEEEF